MADKELWVRIRANASELEAELKKSASVVDSVGRRLQGIGRELTVGVTAPLAAIAAGATRAQLAAEDAFTEMAKTVDAPIEQLEALRDRFEELSENKIPKTANELTRLAALGGQLGITTDALEGFVETVAALDISTDLGAEDAATGLAQFSNIMGTAQRDFDRLGSVIVDLGNNLATTESRILDMGLRLAGAGRQVGLTEAQVLAFAGALSSAGLEAQAGGSAFSKVFSTMAQAAAGGGEQLARFASVAGMSAAEFAKAFREDAAQAVIAFLRGLRNMSDEGRNVFGVLESLELGERRVTDAVLRSAGSIDTMVGALERGSKAWFENSALTEEAQKFYERAGAEFERLKNRVVNTAAELGEQLIPAFRNVMTLGQRLLDNVVRPLINAFAGLPDPIQFGTIAIVGLTAAIGPLLIAAGQLIRTIVALRGAFVALQGVQALGGLAALLTPGGALLAGLAALAGLIVLLQDRTIKATPHVQALREQVDRLRDSLDGLSKADLQQVLASLGGKLSNATIQIAEAEAEVARLKARRAERGPALVSPSGFTLDPVDRQLDEALARAAQRLEQLRAERQAIIEQQREVADALMRVGEAAREGEDDGRGRGSPNLDRMLVQFEELTEAQRRVVAGLGPQGIAGGLEQAENAFTRWGERGRQMMDVVAIANAAAADRIDAVRDQLRAAGAELEVRLRDLQGQLRQLEASGFAMASSVGDAFGRFVSGAQSLAGAVRSAVDQILQELLRLSIQESIVEPLAGVFSNILGAGRVRGEIEGLASQQAALQAAAAALSGSGAALAGSAAAISGSGVALTGSATALTGAAGALVAAATALGAARFGEAAKGIAASVFNFSLQGGFIPGFAEGGFPRVGHLSVVGERGPELFIPGVAGAIVPLGRGDAATRPITVQVHNTITAVESDVRDFDRRLREHQGTLNEMTLKGAREAAAFLRGLE